MKSNENFLSCESVKLLKELSETPYDLRTPGSLGAERFQRYRANAVGLCYSFALERLDDGVIDGLISLAKERGIVERMSAMQRGEIVNVIEGFDSENRPALHTATRDWVLQQEQEGDTEAVRDIREKSAQEYQKLQSFLERIGDDYNTMIQVGIGGSELGPHALYKALSHPDQKRKVYFVSNIDPDAVVSVTDGLDLSRTLVVVVSKSGSTLETTTNEVFLREIFERNQLDPSEHFIAVTGEGSPMDNHSQYMETFYMWDSIGGRYSSTSMVGGVALAFAFGCQVFSDLLQGAAEMDQVALESDIMRNLPAISALIGIWNRNFLGYPTVAIIPYSEALLRFPAHLQQCTMESNGKRVSCVGDFVNFSTSPIVWGEVGTNSQHSFFQLFHQGSEGVPVEFIGFRKSRFEEEILFKGTSSHQKLYANMLAQALALARGESSENPNKVFPGNRPSSILIADQLDPKTLGALLAFYEHRIVFQGFCWGINSFDQEGVALGKRLADSILSVLSGKGASEDSVIESLLRVFDGE